MKVHPQYKTLSKMQYSKAKVKQIYSILPIISGDCIWFSPPLPISQGDRKTEVLHANKNPALFALTLFLSLPYPLCFQGAKYRYAVSPPMLWGIAKAKNGFYPTARSNNHIGTVAVELLHIHSILAGQIFNILDFFLYKHHGRCLGIEPIYAGIRLDLALRKCHDSQTPIRRDACAARGAVFLEHAKGMKYFPRSVHLKYDLPETEACFIC